MFKDHKWIEYAILILNAINEGASTTTEIFDAIKPNVKKSYGLRVVAALRRNGLIDIHYNITKKFKDITVSDILRSTDIYGGSSQMTKTIIDVTLDKLETFPICSLAHQQPSDQPALVQRQQS